MPDAEILLYNLKDDDRTRQIRRYLNKAKIKLHIVRTPEFLQPLGYLFGLPGFQPNPQFNLSGNFSDEMLVMKDFSNEQLDGFLGFFKENELAPVGLKAILTPVNQRWDSLKLHEELMEERAALEK